MLLLDALSAEYSEMVGAVEVSNPLLMIRTHLPLQSLLIVFVQVEVGLGQDRVFLDYFIEDVDVEWQSLSTLQLLDQLPADGASHSVLVM